MDQLWDMADSGLSDANTIRTILHGNTKAAGIVGNVVQMLNGLGNGDGDWYDLQLWRMGGSLVQAGMQVAQWRDAVQTVEFVEALLNLGYSLVQVHPTVDGTNGTEVANWVETLLEQGDIRIAAAGLSEFLSGIEPLPEKVKALQYAGRLVKVADAVDDSTLDQQVLKAEFLSHLVNLGGAYTLLKPIANSITQDSFFLATAWADPYLVKKNLIANQLEKFLTEDLQTYSERYALIKYKRDVLISLFKILNEEISNLPYVPIELGGGIGGPNPYQSNYGRTVESNIVIDYASQHSNYRLFHNNYISTILKEYQLDLQANRDLTDGIPKQDLEKRPDLFVYSRDFVYEIKNYKDINKGYSQVTGYIGIFARAGIDVRYGLTTENDQFLYGVVPAPNIYNSKSFAIYMSPLKGVIIYRGVKYKDPDTMAMELTADDIYDRISQGADKYGIPVVVFIGLLALWEAARAFPLRNLVPV